MPLKRARIASPEDPEDDDDDDDDDESVEVDAPPTRAALSGDLCSCADDDEDGAEGRSAAAALRLVPGICMQMWRACGERKKEDETNV